MKYVKLFENWEEKKMISPEEFNAGIEKIIDEHGQNPGEVIRAARKFIKEHPYPYFGEHAKKYFPALRLLVPFIEKISPDEREILQKEIYPEGYEDPVSRKQRQKREESRMEQWELSRQKREKEKRNRALEILDGYKNGSLDQDQAVEKIMSLPPHPHYD